MAKRTNDREIQFELWLYAELKKQLPALINAVIIDERLIPERKEVMIRDYELYKAMLQARIHRLTESILALYGDEKDPPFLEEAISLKKGLGDHKPKAETIAFQLDLFKIGCKAIEKDSALRDQYAEKLLKLSESLKEPMLAWGNPSHREEFLLLRMRLNGMID